MNFSECGDMLNITRDGARKMILRNEKELKKFLIYKNNKVVGIKEEGIEPLRNLKQRRSKTILKKSKEIESLTLKIEYQEKEISMLNKVVNEYEKSINSLRDDNEKLKAVLNEYQSLNFFQRLLGYKKN